MSLKVIFLSPVIAVSLRRLTLVVAGLMLLILIAIVARLFVEQGVR